MVPEQASVSGVATGERARERMVRRYFDACNEGSREKFRETLAEDCVHYFPLGSRAPCRGWEAIADLWIGFVQRMGSVWTVDRVICGDDVVIEWSHFMPKVGARVRGTEWYEFDQAGKIKEIRAYYTPPPDYQGAVSELDGYPYPERGYAMEPPPGCRNSP